jgi:hypothetical protein
VKLKPFCVLKIKEAFYLPQRFIYRPKLGNELSRVNHEFSLGAVASQSRYPKTMNSRVNGLAHRIFE